MAGKTVILIPNQTLFKQGDASDGMYLVRKGELCVFIEQNGKEIRLATIAEGGMIGEMALFDNQARSASVKALNRTEVTLISTADFNNLMKQIPKWFKGVMSTLSTRLRASNERVQKMEAENSEGSQKILTIQRILNVTDLIWHRDGDKVGKEWQLEKKPLVSLLSHLYGEEKHVVEGIFDGLIKEEVFGSKQNSYKNEVLTTNTRATLTRFLLFLGEYSSLGRTGPISVAALDILRAMESLSKEVAYDSFKADFPQLEAQAKKIKLKSIAEWEQDHQMLNNLHPELKLNKGQDGPFVLQANKKSLKDIVKFHSLIIKLSRNIS